MKTKLTQALWLLFTAYAFITSCSKGDGDKNNSSFDSYLKMRVDGIPWETDDSFEVKFIEPGLTIDEIDDSYDILLTAMQSGEGETFSITLRLPLDKIDNPLGSYPIASEITQSGMAPGTAEIHYYNKAVSEIAFVSRADPAGSPYVGTLTITEFEKSDGTVEQRKTNRLQGSFSATLKGMKQGYATGEVIEITEGTFDMYNALPHIDN
ncbi:hypothetical protein [Sinomicrobium sp.]